MTEHEAMQLALMLLADDPEVRAAVNEVHAKGMPWSEILQRIQRATDRIAKEVP